MQLTHWFWDIYIIDIEKRGAFMNQIIVFFVILGSLILFIRGKIRYDIVAVMGLLILVVFGIVPAETAFNGFSHPAIISVIAILIVSSGLIKTGAVEELVHWMNQTKGSISIKILSLSVMTAVLSSFMNNVGALAIIMPIAINVGKKNKISVSSLLMPVAAASLLGGLVTEIGTPPNLIISMARNKVVGEPFSLFSFAPVGLLVAVVGILFISFVGWRLIPKRKGALSHEEVFKVENYLVEFAADDKSVVVGKTLKEITQKNGIEWSVLSIIRRKKRIVAPLGLEKIETGDLLIVKIEHTEIARTIEKTGLKLNGSKINAKESGKILNSDAYELVEVVLKEDSVLVGNNAVRVDLRNQYDVNLVAVSRKGHSIVYRIKTFKFQPGDVLLLQVKKQNRSRLYKALRCLPLASRGVNDYVVYSSGKRLISILIFLTSVLLTTCNLLPVQISFSIAAVAMVLTGILSLKDFYEAIEWPIVLLLGSMLPIGEALESTGGAMTIAGILFKANVFFSPPIMIGLLMFVTMLLTNLINNATAAVLMAPIAIELARQMGVSVDPMLMAVTVASSSAFLTPIGHQSNTLVMGPGGYQFDDYWKMGLPLSILVLIIGTPLILWIWPL